ncbi:MAG: hypothetical protein ABIQ11_04945 [Saprospiraceae bacterium]
MAFVSRLMKIKKRWIILGTVVLSMALCSIPEIVHTNAGLSESTGSVRKGKLNNGYLIPFNGPNYHFFSHFSYYILNNAYVNSRVYATVMDAYKACESNCPGKEYILMECTRKHGGRMIFHWTHKNGMSVDFMTPKLNGTDINVWPNSAGLVHYLFKFNEDGKFSLGSKTQIDFEAMACHLLAIDDAAQQNGLRIRKILFKTEMHDNLFNTPSGKLLADRDINFIPNLRDLINRFHDDHYHVDFEFVGE